MIRKFIFGALYYLQISSMLQWINKRKGRFPILVFHRVSPHNDPYWPPLSVKAFEEILVLLEKKYTILPLENILEYTNKQLSNACFITFDDGFEDNYTWARPLLLKHATPASFFIPTNAMTSGKVIWPLQIRNSLHHTSAKKLTLMVDNAEVSFALSNEQEKIRAYDTIIKYLSALKEKDFLNMLSFIFESLGKFDDDYIQIMNKSQLNELALGFGIHSHTRNHYYLSALSKERVVEEFSGSINDLKDWFPTEKIKFLAYPIGDYSQEVAIEAHNYFEASFRVGEEPVESRKLTDGNYRMEIPRFNMHHESPHEVYALINGIHKYVKLVKNLGSPEKA